MGAIAIAVLGAMVVSSEGAPEPKLQPPTRAEYCKAVRDSTRDLREQYPATPEGTFERGAAEACEHEPTLAPTPEPTAVVATPGCRRIEGPMKKLRPRSVAAPRRPIPFFAARAGALPRDGSATVGGVRVPRGSRCDRFWRTDAGVEDAFGLARQLASAFPRTGLWPLVWAWVHEPPDSYVYDTGDPARADDLDAGTVLRKAWDSFDGDEPFPGLAEAAGDAGAADVDPFDDALEESLPEGPAPGGWVVMLVPVNRPADVFSLLGSPTEYFRDDELTAVFRSWEERFGAVPVVLGPGTIDLAVASPPRDGDQRERLAAEHEGLTADPESSAISASAQRWSFAFPD